MLLTEKSKKSPVDDSSRILSLMENINFDKFTKELIVFEFKKVKDILPINEIVFEKVSMYLKEYKNLFELCNDNEELVSLIYTFNVNYYYSG